MEIRIARPDEYEQVGELTLAAYLPLFERPELGRYGAELKDVASRAERGHVVVAELDGRLVGALLYVDDYNVELDHIELTLENSSGFRVLAVDPNVQGKGVGKQLVQWCINRSVADGRSALVLNTTDYMQAAQRLYVRLGFVPFPEMEYSVGHKNPVPVLAFRLDLTGSDGANTK
ncbi:MAG: GNAT superfamily N-acetyltransferase [Candidatus Poriferisodalaceae bacterium]|jgi:GNAT superfamily N-acetyltransferase